MFEKGDGPGAHICNTYFDVRFDILLKQKFTFCQTSFFYGGVELFDKGIEFEIVFWVKGRTKGVLNWKTFH